MGWKLFRDLPARPSHLLAFLERRHLPTEAGRVKWKVMENAAHQDPFFPETLGWGGRIQIREGI